MNRLKIIGLSLIVISSAMLSSYTLGARKKKRRKKKPATSARRTRRSTTSRRSATPATRTRRSTTLQRTRRRSARTRRSATPATRTRRSATSRRSATPATRTRRGYTTPDEIRTALGHVRKNFEDPTMNFEGIRISNNKLNMLIGRVNPRYEDIIADLRFIANLLNDIYTVQPDYILGYRLRSRRLHVGRTLEAIRNAVLRREEEVARSRREEEEWPPFGIVPVPEEEEEGEQDRSQSLVIIRDEIIRQMSEIGRSFPKTADPKDVKAFFRLLQETLKKQKESILFRIEPTRGEFAAEPRPPAEEGPTCPICMDPFTRLEPSIETPCKHKFHEVCITRALTNDKRCPICRKAIEAGADGSIRFIRSRGRRRQ